MPHVDWLAASVEAITGISAETSKVTGATPTIR